MKKFAILLTAMVLMSTMGFAQCIEKKLDLDGGGTLSITSAEKLFSGCKIRMCKYKKGEEKYYGIELDMTDRASRVSKGNLFTIHFEDGTRISLANLFDTKADVDEETHVESFDHVRTDFVPVYDAWADAIYSVPVDVHYREHTPVTTQTTFASLYYVVSEHEVNDIISKEVKNISIVTNDETIVKKARPLSKVVAELFAVVK